MSDTATNPGEWMPYFQQAMSSSSNISSVIPSGHQFSDATTVTSTNMLINNNSSTLVGDGNLSSQGSITKPVKRRPRASRRTPITLLNASTTNFRALVQQYTGCQTANPSSMIRSQKGPVNLSFGLSSEQHDLNVNPNSGASSFSYNHHYYNQEQLNQAQVQQEDQQMYQDSQVSVFSSFGTGGGDDHAYFPMFGNITPNISTPEDIANSSTDHQDFSSHELGISSSYVHKNDGYYFSGY